MKKIKDIIIHWLGGFTESELKRKILFTYYSCLLVGTATIAFWNVQLNWHHRLGFGEYPTSFRIATLICGLAWLCLVVVDRQTKGK